MFNIFYFLLFIIFCTQKDPMYNRQNMPSTWGITQYVEKNEKNIIDQYEQSIDTLYDVYIYVENLGRNNDLGNFYIPDQIVITNQEQYIGYNFNDLFPSQKKYFRNERTVNSVIFHELSHAYIYQITTLIKHDTTLTLFPAYDNFVTIPNSELRYGALFIEEGICEYIVSILNESIIIKKPYIPKTKKNLLNKNYEFLIKYEYSAYYLKDFLDKYGIKEGIKILTTNKPPTFEEILKPDLYFNRLNYIKKYGYVSTQ